MSQLFLDHARGAALLCNRAADHFEDLLYLLTPCFALVSGRSVERILRKVTHLVDAPGNACGSRRGERSHEGNDQADRERRAKYEKQHKSLNLHVDDLANP
jgi:hypothetical protein